jgi:hypothetical protein
LKSRYFPFLKLLMQNPRFLERLLQEKMPLLQIQLLEKSHSLFLKLLPQSSRLLPYWPGKAHWLQRTMKR